MAKILTEGCIADCGCCKSKFSFELDEVCFGSREVPAGYSPEEEAYTVYTFFVLCPKCNHSVRVDESIGEEVKNNLVAKVRVNRF